MGSVFVTDFFLTFILQTKGQSLLKVPVLSDNVDVSVLTGRWNEKLAPLMSSAAAKLHDKFK